MTNPVAVLVEDDPQQAEVSRGVLEAAGYVVSFFDSIVPAQDHIRNSTDLIDLFVLDRRLPMAAGEPPADEFGDELLREVRSTYPDARLIVFTGFATIRHVQDSLQGGGQLPSQSTDSIDRVTVLEKDQSLEFKQQVEQYRSLLQSLDDIEIIPISGTNSLSALERRVLRRLAFGYQAVSVSVTALGGGLTGASVWRCEINRSKGHAATVVAKLVKSPGSPGGLSELLPRVNTTATVRTMSGLMAGRHLNVLQLAGESPQSLMDVIADHPAHAVELARPVWRALREISAHQAALTVGDLCESLIAWDRLTELLSEYEINAPARTLSVTAQIGPRHGDLHPGNILIDNDHAVLIDFDSEVFAAGALDPITLLISTLVHPDSPIRGDGWPSPTEITSLFGTPQFGQGHPCEAWFSGVQEWVEECQPSSREYWTLVLAYATRQFQYQDVLADQQTVERVVALAARAAEALGDT